MIRIAAAVIGLALGLAAAALSEGRMGHLRALAGAALPGWTEAVAADARLWRGRAGAGNPRRQGAVLRWSLAGLSRDGLRWRVELTAPGARVEAMANLSPAAPEILRLADLSGHAALAPLLAAARTTSTQAPLAAEGQVAVSAGAGAFDLRDGTLTTLEAQGTLEAVTLDGLDLGSGPVRLRLRAADDWDLTAALEGGASDAQAEARPEGGDVALMLTVAGDAAGLPEAWRARVGLEGSVLRARLPGPS